jgi:hypothetical protein
MAFNISEFSANIGRYGVLQNNKFLVFFTSPLPVKLGSFSDVGNILNTFSTERMIQLRAEQARIPGLTIQSTDNKRYGLGTPQKMPYNVSFTDTSFTFLADADSEIHRYFYSWMTSVVDFNGTTLFRRVPSFTVEYKQNYATDIYIFVFDNYGNITQIVTLYDAYPNSLNDVGLDWGNPNSLMKITVGFTYNGWTLNNVNSAIAGGLDFLVNLATDFFAQTNTNQNVNVGQDETTASSNPDASAVISNGVV